jgi:hypothetical protein
MVTPDYQDFANPAAGQRRDNTVICAAHASGEMPKSARRCAIATPTGTKAELSARWRAEERHLCPE